MGSISRLQQLPYLAKTYRDELMKTKASEHLGYGWETNMGYPTKSHRAAIEKLGTTPLHRMSFQLLLKTARTLS